MEWGPKFSKWGPNGDLILSEMGTFDSRNGDLKSVYLINLPNCANSLNKEFFVEKIFTACVII